MTRAIFERRMEAKLEMAAPQAQSAAQGSGKRPIDPRPLTPMALTMQAEPR
jgi:hypothetical protein